jgi:hypothetical protein
LVSGACPFAPPSPVFEDFDRRRDICGCKEDETRNDDELGIINKEAGARPAAFILQFKGKGSEYAAARKVRKGALGAVDNTE